MNKLKPESIFYFILLVLIIIFLIILVVNPRNTEGFNSNNKKHHKHKNHSRYVGKVDDKLRLIYNLDPSEYYTLVEKYKALNNQYKTSLSWESDSVVKNNKMNSLMSILYNRACPPQLISSMPGYTFYGPSDFNLNDSQQMIERNKANKFDSSGDNTNTVIT